MYKRPDFNFRPQVTSGLATDVIVRICRLLGWQIKHCYLKVNKQNVAEISTRRTVLHNFVWYFRRVVKLPGFVVIG